MTLFLDPRTRSDDDISSPQWRFIPTRMDVWSSVWISDLDEIKKTKAVKLQMPSACCAPYSEYLVSTYLYEMELLLAGGCRCSFCPWKFVRDRELLYLLEGMARFVQRNTIQHAETLSGLLIIVDLADGSVYYPNSFLLQFREARPRPPHLSTRQDVFAIGRILYDALHYGARPFFQTEGASYSGNGLFGSRSDTTLNLSREMPSSLAALLRRALEPEAEGKFRDVHELHQALVGVIDKLRCCMSMPSGLDRPKDTLRRAGLVLYTQSSAYREFRVALISNTLLFRCAAEAGSGERSLRERTLLAPFAGELPLARKAVERLVQRGALRREFWGETFLRVAEIVEFNRDSSTSDVLSSLGFYQPLSLEGLTATPKIFPHGLRHTVLKGRLCLHELGPGLVPADGKIRAWSLPSFARRFIAPITCELPAVPARLAPQVSFQCSPGSSGVPESFVAHSHREPAARTPLSAYPLESRERPSPAPPGRASRCRLGRSVRQSLDSGPASGWHRDRFGTLGHSRVCEAPAVCGAPAGIQKPGPLLASRSPHCIEQPGLHRQPACAGSQSRNRAASARRQDARTLTPELLAPHSQEIARKL